MATDKKNSVDAELGVVNQAFVNDAALDVGEKKGSILSNNLELPVNSEEPPAREQWDNPIEFLLSCIAMSVGLGNIWRFPYVAFKNGGGAFLIPYLIVLTFIGRPIYFLELSLGQFSSNGQVKLWRMSPIFKGVGYGAMLTTIYTVSFYGSIMGLTIFYFFASFQATLPWSECSDDWVGLGRGSFKDPDSGIEEAVLECNSSDLLYAYDVYTGNRSNISISQLYFENEVLKQISSIDNGIGAPEWRQTLCLLLAWIAIWGSLVKGISSSGKVAYFTALFPYVVLIIMLIRGVTLPGAWEGIEYFITPQWDKMAEPTVWYEAVGQCFFSLGTGFGTIVMFSSYNPFRHNIYRDAWIISGLDTLTSLLAGFTIFAVLGSLANELGVEVQDVAKAGPGLAFVSYPAAIARFDWVPQLFSVLFYLMLFTLGVGTATSLTNGVIQIICDQFTKIPRLLVTTLVCGGLFLSGLLFVTPGGQFMVELFSHFGANFPLYIMAAVETIAVAWVYGLSNVIKDIEFMLGVRIGWYWKFSWGFFIPVGLTVILFYALGTEKRLTYDGYDYPDSAIVCGWLLAVTGVMIPPIFAVRAMLKTETSDGFIEKVKEASRPTSKWGPSNPTEKANWIAFKSKYD